MARPQEGHKTNRVRVHFDIDEEHFERLKKLTERLALPRNQTINLAIVAFLDRHDPI